MFSIKKSILGISTIAIFIALSTTGCNRKVTRIDPDTVTDLSGQWNNTDASLTAEAISTKMLAAQWLGDYMAAAKKKPTLVVGLVTNKSHEHVDAEIFIKDIEKALLKSQATRLVQAGDRRKELRAERADQEQFASKETAKKWGKELGADYILQGSIKSIVDETVKNKVVYKQNERTTYWQIDMELTNVETNEIVWLDDWKGKKYIKR